MDGEAYQKAAECLTRSAVASLGSREAATMWFKSALKQVREADRKEFERKQLASKTLSYNRNSLIK